MDVELKNILEKFPNKQHNNEMYFPVIQCAKILGYSNPYEIAHSLFKISDYKILESDARIKYIDKNNFLTLIMANNNDMCKRFSYWLIKNNLIEIKNFDPNEMIHSIEVYLNK